MKIILTGSLGRISKPLTAKLVEQGHSVTVISSNAGKQNEIQALKATAAIGSITDRLFLAKTFSGADLVYLMEPPPDFFDHHTDTTMHWTNIATNYAEAVQQAGVSRVIHLSSIGAHTDKGNGMLAAHYYVEKILNELPGNVAIKFMRPVGFYYNMFAFMPTIKTQGAIYQNYGGDEKEPWVSPLDIAEAIASETGTPFTGRTIHYLASDEVSPNEIARVLGNAIGNPDLTWITIPDDQFLDNLVAAGFSTDNARGLTDMNIGRRNNLYEDYHRNKPALGKIKLKDFGREFALVYNQSIK